MAGTFGLDPLTVLGGETGRRRIEAEDPDQAWAIRVAAHNALAKDSRKQAGGR